MYYLTANIRFEVFGEVEGAGWEEILSKVYLGDMWPNLLEYGWLKVSVFGIYMTIAAVWSSFVLWKRMRLDMADAEIFGMTINLAIGMAAGNMLWSLVETGKWFALSGWGIVLGGFWVVWDWSKKNKFDFWELTDWLVVLALWFWFFGAIAYGPAAKYAVGYAFLTLVLIRIIRANYRKFGWYKSGRVGLTGMLAIVMYAIYEIVMGVIAPIKIYWWGLTLSQTLGAWVIAICLVTVYLRGGNKFKFK